MKRLAFIVFALFSFGIAYCQQPAFLGISVGTSIDEFVSQLETQGFSIQGSDQKIVEYMYIVTSGNLTGTYINYPATAKLYASILTRTVTNVHVEFYFNDDVPIELQVDNIIKLFEQKYGRTEYYNKGLQEVKPTIENANMARWHMQKKPAIVMTFIGSKCQFDFGFADNTLIKDEEAQKKSNQVAEHKQHILSQINPTTEF